MSLPRAGGDRVASRWLYEIIRRAHRRYQVPGQAFSLNAVTTGSSIFVLGLILRPNDLGRDLNRTDRFNGPCKQTAATKLHTQIRRQLEARFKTSG